MNVHANNFCGRIDIDNATDKFESNTMAMIRPGNN